MRVDDLSKINPKTLLFRSIFIFLFLKQLASSIGIFIHKAFEYYLEKKTWNKHYEWKNIVQNEELEIQLTYSNLEWKLFFEDSLTEINNTLKITT